MKGIVCVAALGVVLAGASWAQDGGEVEFKVLAVQGSAEYKELGKGAKWQALKENMVLKRGTSVQTGLKSKVFLQFGADTKILVKSSTLVTLTEGWAKENQVTGKLHVELGGIRVDVNEKRKEQLDFKVSTPEATASVRGTGFGIDSWSDLGTFAKQYYGSVTFGNTSGVQCVLDDAMNAVYSQMIADMVAYLAQMHEMMMAMESAYDQDSYMTAQNQQTQTLSLDGGTMALDPSNMQVKGPIGLMPNGSSFSEFRRGDVIDSYLEHQYIGSLLNWTDDTWVIHQTKQTIFLLSATGPHDIFFNFGGKPVWHLKRIAFTPGSLPFTKWRLERVGTGSGFEFQRGDPATPGSWTPY